MGGQRPPLIASRAGILSRKANDSPTPTVDVADVHRADSGRHQTLGTSNKQFPSLGCSPQQPQFTVVPAALLSMHGHLSQSHAAISLRCRRPRMRTAWPCSPRRCEDGLLHRATSGRGLPGPPPPPGRAGYCLIGFEDAQKRLGLGSRAESRRWGWSLQGAMLTGQHTTSQLHVIVRMKHVPDTLLLLHAAGKTR